ncbi:MAG: hypothetical protein ACFFED_06020, partial [Candidatus Thorarchaeota archaeon]
SGAALLKVTNKTLDTLLREIRSTTGESLTLLAVEGGIQTSMKSLIDLLPSDSRIPVILGVGAFPHGDFQSTARDLFKHHIELDSEVMMAWHVCNEILWCYSLKHDVIAKRYGK